MPSVLAGFVGERLSAPYKDLPVHPLVSPAVDFSFRNISKVRPSCANCFPQTSQDLYHNYVDLFDFPKFGGMPYPVLPGGRPPSPWFADLRYTIVTPLPHTYDSVYEEVVGSKRVTAAMEAEEAKCLSTSRKMVLKKVKSFYYEIRATLSRFICKICAYILFKVFRRFMTRLLISPLQMRRVVEAENTGTPLVYLPLHRSHFDYLLITWTAWHFGLRLPHIASGDNLNLSGLGWLLRSTGAFFIRRRTDENEERGRDACYRAVLHSYIEELLKKGLSIEFFIEGTRCRFGKSQLPKHGLISNVVKAVQEKTITDCYLVPVSYTYDSVAEGVFLDELMGIPKKRESVLRVLYGVLKSLGKSRRCGAVRMHFGSPILLTDYMKALHEALSSRTVMPQLTRIPHAVSYRELVPWQAGHKEKPDDRSLIRAIGYHVVHEAQNIISISLVSVVCSLLLCKFRRGVSINVLSADCQWLCDLIVADGSDVVGWHGGETCGRDAIEYALPHIHDSIERIIDEDADNYNVCPVTSHRQLLNLAFNKNALVPLFALRSAIGMSMVSRGIGRHLFENVLEDVALICDWMQFEVIFCKPCEDLRAVIAVALGRNGLGHIHDGALSMHGDEDDAFGGDEPQLQVRNERSRHLLLFYSNFLRPFMQSLYIVLSHLLSGVTITKESDVIRGWCRDSTMEKLQLPFQLLLEAVNSDSFRNCLRLLRHKGILAEESQELQRESAEEMRQQLLRFLIVE
ncbi:hypothetical protein V3C99_015203 [Haemonchus contortus]